MTHLADVNPGSELPCRFPIFPLPGAILLPGGNLPLNIFEPRYRAMTRDAMRGARIIGMIQPRQGGQALYPVGCAGRITSFHETEDGRYLITLTGLCRYEVVQELEVTTPYRQIDASFERWRVDMAPASPCDALRPRLVAALRRYFAIQGITVDWQQIDVAPLFGLLTSLAMICPFEPCEKQALLEAPNPDALGQTLIALLQMGGAEERCCARH